jgi:hypothetical protein
LHLRNLHHKPAFGSARSLCENIQNYACSVKHLDSGQAFFQVSHLGAAQILIENHHIGIVLFEGETHLFNLAFANERSGVKGLNALQKGFNNLSPSRLRKPLQLLQIFLRLLRFNLWRGYSYQYCFFRNMIFSDLGLGFNIEKFLY